MTYRGAALAAILCSLIAACGANGAPSAPPVTPSSSSADVELSPAAASPTPAATPASPSPTATPRPTSKPTPVPVPPKPTGVRFGERTRLSDDEAIAEVTQTVTWRAPQSAGVEIRVYGVTQCMAEPANPSPGTSGPCLVEHTPLPASVRTLLATAPASDGAASWGWAEETGCRAGLAYDRDGPAYHSIVVAAYNASGHSIFAIAEPGGWWRPGTGDTVC